MSSTDQRIVWVDLETGGLDPVACQIIQVAAVATGPAPHYTIHEQFERKLELVPGRWSQGALARNCYNEEVWARQAVTSDEARRDFAAFLLRHATWTRLSRAGNRSTVARLGGHNLDFDLAFLRAWCGKDLIAAASAWTGGYVDTIHGAVWATQVTGLTWSSHRLEDLCHDLRVPLEGAHDALADVLATIAVARELVVKILGCRYPTGGWQPPSPERYPDPPPCDTVRQTEGGRHGQE